MPLLPCLESTEINKYIQNCMPEFHRLKAKIYNRATSFESEDHSLYVFWSVNMSESRFFF